jgi:membrane protease subunit (stomatin/prohibitin family)
MRQWTNLKFFTDSPITMRDRELGYVRIRTFGTYDFQVSDPKVFLQQMVFTDPSFETLHSPQRHVPEISDQLRNTVVSRIGDVIRDGKISIFDLAESCEKVSGLALEAVTPTFAEHGLTPAALCVLRISLPPEVEEARQMRARAGAEHELPRYGDCQSAIIFDDAAEIPDGIAGAEAAGGQQSAKPTDGSAGPPPIPVRFFVAVNGVQTGPFLMNEMAEKARDGSLKREMLVWKEGLRDWIPAGTAPELQSLFAVPPPIPSRFKTMTG